MPNPHYYNDNEPYVAQWLRNLISAKLIPYGTVDTRSITEIAADDLKEFTQCHFFGGLAGWSLALKYAGWEPTTPVWTGSCPCQPFSVAGRHAGTADSRHLWPEFYRLISLCRPPVIFGEQVASNLGRNWLSGVRSDLEDMAYAVGAADLCAASAGAEGIVHSSRGPERVLIGAPHIRQRLYWGAIRLGDTEYSQRRPEYKVNEDTYGRSGLRGSSDSRTRFLGDNNNTKLEGWEYGSDPGGPSTDQLTIRPASATHWNSFDILPCADGKARRVESGTFPLAHGIPGRVGKLRAYGNALVAPLAEEFIKAFREAIDEVRP